MKENILTFYTLILLFAINLVNYMDRYLVSGALPIIQKDLMLSDTQAGALMTAFIVVYMVVCPLFGWLGDRFVRKYLISCGVFLWSFAATGTFFVRNYITLLCCRAMAGIGESSYSTTAPTVIADLVPMENRGRALAFFYLAIPVGSALGFILGGWIGKNYDWRYAFLGSGILGLILAGCVLTIREPKRGDSDKKVKENNCAVEQESLPWKKVIPHLFHTPSFIWITLGLTFMTFAMGGMAHWMPLFLGRCRGVAVDDAAFLFGAMTVIAGILGTFAGGWLGDYYQKKYPGAYFGLCAFSMFLSVPFSILSLYSNNPAIFWPAIFFAEFFLFLNTGPGNTIIANVVPAKMRATAFAANTFCIHLLGDAISPTVIGGLSDWISKQNSPEILATVSPATLGLSQTLFDTVTNIDKANSLGYSLYIMPIAMVLSGLFFTFGIPHLSRDTKKALEN